MNPHRTLVAFGLLISVVCISGCKEGGRFLGQVGTHVEDEGREGPELASTVRRFMREAGRRPEQMRTNWQNAVKRDEVQREILTGDLRNWVKRERETLPNIDLEGQDLGYGYKVAHEQRKFPGEGE